MRGGAGGRIQTFFFILFSLSSIVSNSFFGLATNTLNVISNDKDSIESGQSTPNNTPYDAFQKANSPLTLGVAFFFRQNHPSILDSLIRRQIPRQRCSAMFFPSRTPLATENRQAPASFAIANPTIFYGDLPTLYHERGCMSRERAYARRGTRGLRFTRGREIYEGTSPNTKSTNHEHGKM